MLVDFKPTHDPNQDTFKVEYLLGGALVLGIVLPPRYQFTEVYTPPELLHDSENELRRRYMLTTRADALGVFPLA